MSRGQTGCPLFIHQKLWVLLVAPFAITFDITHLNSADLLAVTVEEDEVH